MTAARIVPQGLIGTVVALITAVRAGDGAMAEAIVAASPWSDGELLAAVAGVLDVALGELNARGLDTAAWMRALGLLDARGEAQ